MTCEEKNGAMNMIYWLTDFYLFEPQVIFLFLNKKTATFDNFVAFLHLVQRISIVKSGQTSLLLVANS